MCLLYVEVNVYWVDEEERFRKGQVRNINLKVEPRILGLVKCPWASH